MDIDLLVFIAYEDVDMENSEKPTRLAPVVEKAGEAARKITMMAARTFLPECIAGEPGLLDPYDKFVSAVAELTGTLGIGTLLNYWGATPQVAFPLAYTITRMAEISLLHEFERALPHARGPDVKPDN